MNTLLSIMACLSFTFMWLNHPLSMAITIIVQTLLIALFMGMMLKSFWFSYILLIIMLSGMLVLFTYMASIASNEKFKTSMKLLLINILLFIMMMLVNNINTNYYTNNELMMNMNKLFSSITMYITMIMVLYLLFSMITISHIVNINEGPLRMKK